jgi:hypothetical protein
VAAAIASAIRDACDGPTPDRRRVLKHGTEEMRLRPGDPDSTPRRGELARLTLPYLLGVLAGELAATWRR